MEQQAGYRELPALFWEGSPRIKENVGRKGMGVERGEENLRTFDGLHWCVDPILENQIIVNGT